MGPNITRTFDARGGVTLNLNTNPVVQSLVVSTLTSEKVLISDPTGEISESSSVDTTELSYLNGVTSGIQAQLDSKASSAAIVAATNAPQVTNWINFRQPASLNLSNWSNIPTGEMANVVSTTFLTNWANAISNRSPYPLFSVTNDVIMTNVATLRSAISNYRGTKTIPGGVLRDGSVIRFRLEGEYSSTANAGGHLNNTNALTLGGVVIATNTIITFASMNRDFYYVDAVITVRSNGSGGMVTTSGFQARPTAAGGAGSTRPFKLVTTPVVAIDLSANQDLDFTFHGTNTTSLIVQQAIAEVIP